MAQDSFKTSSSIPSSGLVLIGLILIATTLRAPVTATGPLIETLSETLHLSSTTAGLVTALPLIAFGIIAPFASIFDRRFGLERCLQISMLIVVVGILTRSLGSVSSLFIGTALIGLGIAFGNVLMPSVIKRDFPTKVPTITGRCGIAIGLAAATASSLMVPLMSQFGWQVALAATALLPLLAVGVWSILPNRDVIGTSSAPNQSSSSPWLSPLAWQVTVFMTINSILFYAVITWLPSILTSYGMSKGQAGSIHGYLQFASLVPGFLLGYVVSKMKNQQLIAGVLGLMQIGGLLGIILAPTLSSVWAVIYGMGSGGALILSLMFIGLRTANARQAVALSGMAQCVNFLIGALGPLLAGQAHDYLGGWASILWFGILLAILMAVSGIMAGRNVKLN